MEKPIALVQTVGELIEALRQLPPNTRIVPTDGSNYLDGPAAVWLVDKQHLIERYGNGNPFVSIEEQRGDF